MTHLNMATVEALDFVLKPLKDFAKNSTRLINKCSKPDKKGGEKGGESVLPREE